MSIRQTLVCDVCQGFINKGQEEPGGTKQINFDDVGLSVVIEYKFNKDVCLSCHAKVLEQIGIYLQSQSKEMKNAKPPEQETGLGVSFSTTQ